MGNMRLHIKVELGGGLRLGPGKVKLLENIRKTGSISAAGRAMDMSYRRAWLLVEEMNQLFKTPVVLSQSGGKSGGGATLTDLGELLVQSYRDIDAKSAKAAQGPLQAIAAHLKPPPRT